MAETPPLLNYYWPKKRSPRRWPAIVLGGLLGFGIAAGITNIAEYLTRPPRWPAGPYIYHKEKYALMVFPVVALFLSPLSAYLADRWARWYYRRGNPDTEE